MRKDMINGPVLREVQSPRSTIGPLSSIGQGNEGVISEVPHASVACARSWSVDMVPKGVGIVAVW